MIKTLIAPVQAWFLSQGRCVGCGRELGGQKQEQSKKVSNSLKVTCACGRIFLKDKKTGRYRRALFHEV
ncbi:MAG: hypothetical protein AAB694_00175 [Patescibacteria group bacterium]